MSQLSVGVISDPLFADMHLEGYAAGPAKVLAVDSALRSNRFPFPFTFSGETQLPPECFIDPVFDASDNLTDAHPEAYISRLRELCNELRSSDKKVAPFQYDEYGVPDLNTLVSERAFEIAQFGTGSIKHALNLIRSGRLQKLFMVKAYMGHHAEYQEAKGFCILNSAAIAARDELIHDPKARIAIIDWDIHHGNGTQHIFENDPRVFYGSIHQENLFPRQSGSRFEMGINEGKGTTLNIPLPAGTTASTYGRSFDELLRAVKEFDPSLIIIECGFDTCQGDALGQFMLQPHHFRTLTSKVVLLSERVAAQGKILSILAGGYTAGIVGEASIRHVQALFEPDRDPANLTMR